MSEAPRKRPRNRREPVGGFVLTARDRRLLQALARFRIARTTDLRRVAFAGVHRDTAGERLRKLFDAACLNVHLGDRSEENVYGLGPKGKAWLRAEGIEVGRVPNGDRAHHLAIVRLWTVLAECARKLAGVRIARALPDWELRERVPGLAPIPDLAVLLHKEGNGWTRTVPIVFEVDLGTEPIATIRGKAELYEAARLNPDGFLGWSDFFLAVFAPVGPKRIASIRSTLDRHWSGGWAVWSQDAEIASEIESLLARRETPRTDSSCGTGALDGASESPTAESAREDGGH